MINDEANNFYYFAVKNFSELNSSGWLKPKKEAIINNNNDNDFEDALDDALNYQTIETNLERISKLKHYINKYNQEGINFPAGSKEWQNLKKVIIKLHLIYCIYPVIQKKNVSKKSHYLAVTNLSALLKGISSNHKEDFYCLNCFNSYTSKNKLKEH